jgi:hypothetical protein
VTPVSIAQIRLCKYLNNIIDQDHLAIKRISRAIRGFKLFLGACITIAGIETVHMTRKGKRYCLDGKTMSSAFQLDPQRCHALLLARHRYCDRTKKSNETLLENLPIFMADVNQYLKHFVVDFW